MTEVLPLPEPESAADDSPNEVPREPVLKRIAEIAMAPQYAETLTQTGMVEETTIQERVVFEQGPSGWLMRKVYDNKGRLIKIGAVSVGTAAVLTAAGLTYAHRRKRR
jgi:hypothetical protein